jgi:hypothetical protein
MTSDIEKAEAIGRQRARIATASAAAFLTTLAASTGEQRLVDHIRVFGWVAWSAMLLIILSGGGGWRQTLGVRKLMNDDVTRENRQRSLAVGFWVAMGTAAITFVVDRYRPFGGQEASRIIITFGIASALLWFGQLERRAHAA